jgi:hypothetical protein
MERGFPGIFDRPVLLASLVAGALALVTGLLIRVFKGASASRAVLVALESFATTALGGWLAFAFISVFLWLGSDPRGAAVAVGTLFLLWPLPLNVLWAGVVTTFAWTVNPLLFDSSVLPWVAWGAGSLIGAFDGYRQIHSWWGWGVPAFISDVTWGLASSINGILIHLINLPRLFQKDASGGRRAKHDDIPRQGHHRYSAGVALKDTFAFTQGSVITNLKSTASPGLYDHEKTHVLQNRIFGPLFWVSYVAWTAVIGLIGWLVANVAPQRKLNKTVILDNHFAWWWGYKNNPWEVWAYKHNPAGRMTVTPAQQAMGTIPTGWNDVVLSWPTAVVIVVTVIVHGLLALWLVPWAIGTFM